MILILCEGGTEPIGQDICNQLVAAYSMPCHPELVTTESVWDRKPEWDDLLIVVFKSKSLPDKAQDYIRAFREAHPLIKPGERESEPGGLIFPVSTNPDHRRPPDPVSGIKAAEYSETESARGAIVKTAGVLLGLALRPGNQRIFVSYRATDGKEIAAQLFNRLEAAGFNAWLDVAGENLTISDDVQDTIRARVKDAALVLLVDTPEAPDSKWVAVEVNCAIGRLIPVVPVVVGGPKASRFIALQGLQRLAVVKSGGFNTEPMSEAEWREVLTEIEQVLLAAYRRRLRIMLRAEQAFSLNGFKWSTVDEPLRMYLAERRKRPDPTTIVLSHCSIHDITYLPALLAYTEFIKHYSDLPRVNYKVCVYDRERLLSDSELAAIDQYLGDDVNFILAHYNELGLLIESNFRRLR